MRKLFILIILTLTLAASAHAEWTRGALFGADVRALVIDPHKADTVYLGTSQGEIYVSHDGAATWGPIRASIPFPGYVVDNLLIDSSNRLWAACWGLWGGGVVAVSADGGKTWSRRDAGLEDFSVRALAVDPGNPDFVVAGGLTGVYQSSDGGRKWLRISDQVNVESLSIDPRTNQRIYVGTWRQAWRTDDGGKNWSLINNGMVLDTDVFSMTVDPANPDDMWVSTCGWVYNTADGGDSWTRYRDGFNNRRIHDIQIDPVNKSALYAGSVAGLYRSVDSGKNWKLTSDEGLVIRRIGLHPDRPNRVILGTEGDGVYVSQDGGQSFTRSSEGLRNLRVTTIVPDPSEKGRIYSAVVFGGAASGIYRSDDGGKGWTRINSTKLPEVLSLVVTNDREAHLIAGTEGGFFWSRDGIDWTQGAPSTIPIRVEKVVWLNATRLFAATSEGVMTTRDGGRNWYRLGDATTRAVDIALGRLHGGRALYALTWNGITAFDGDKWVAIAGSPTKGRTLAIRTEGDDEEILIAGVGGVKGGKVTEDGRWFESPAPDAAHAAVFTANLADRSLLFLTSRQQREILVSDSRTGEWRTFSLPGANSDIATIAPDPFDHDRYYVGTVGEGVFVYQGLAQKYVSASNADGGYSTAGGSK
jgi:photosystem II stability/assembly factor-like uncharacterized protein